MATAQDLEYYIGRKPTADEIAEADGWQKSNPGDNLSEWVDAMREIGAL